MAMNRAGETPVERSNRKRKWSNGLLLMCAALTLLLGAGCASRPRVDLTGVQQIDISGDYDDALLNDLATSAGSGALNAPMVIRVPAGFPLPVALRIQSPVVEMNSDCATLHFREDVYVYLSNEQMLISPDSEQWAPFPDLDEIRELFGLGDGQLAISMSSSKQRGARLEVAVRVE